MMWSQSLPVRACSRKCASKPDDSKALKLILGFISIFVPIGATKFFQFNDAGFIPDLPGDDLLSMLAVVGFDDGPAAMGSIMATPFKMMQIPRRVDFLDNCITFICIVRGFD